VSMRGGRYVCAVLLDGALVCWGESMNCSGGKCLVQPPTKVAIPVPVKTILLDYGDSENYAVGTDGSVWLWSDGLTPTKVPALQNVTDIYWAGCFCNNPHNFHMFAVTSDRRTIEVSRRPTNMNLSDPKSWGPPTEVSALADATSLGYLSECIPFVREDALW